MYRFVKRMKKWMIPLTVILALVSTMVVFAEEPENQEDDGIFQIMPYQDVLVGPKEIDSLYQIRELLGVRNTLEFEAICKFIEQKEASWILEQSLKMEAAGIPVENQYFIHGETYEDVSKQILAMTAVHRGYTFYNRIVCQWYADNLWEETYTYHIHGTGYQEKAVESLLPFAGAAVKLFGIGKASIGDALTDMTALLKNQYKVVVV